MMILLIFMNGLLLLLLRFLKLWRIFVGYLDIFNGRRLILLTQWPSFELSYVNLALNCKNFKYFVIG